MRGYRQHGTDRDDEDVNVEFWGRGSDRFKARIAPGIVLVVAIMGIAGLAWLAIGLA